MTSEATPKVEVTWSQKLTDFTVLLKSGEKVKVHKHILAENSEVFERMLTNKKYEETKNGQVSLEHFEQATVISFLEYMYAGAINDPKTIQKFLIQ